MRLTEIVNVVTAALAGFSADRLKGNSGTSHVRIACEQLGPTFAKFGQAAANRPDLVGSALADELRLLQDAMPPFSTKVARQIISEDLGAAAEPILAALPEEAAAAASIGVVYRVPLADGRVVAVKVMRPEVQEQVRSDLALARSVAAWAETLAVPGGGRLLKPELVTSVEEFFSRLLEEMDYVSERDNLRDFDELYGAGGEAAARLRRSGGGEVITPTVLPQWCSERVLTMSWIEGEPLMKQGQARLPASELPLVDFGLRCTLSQLLETGVMHADPHAGNLLKLPKPSARAYERWLPRALRRKETPRLAYLDFGLVSRVPLQVREALVCAVSQLVFAKNVTAVAGLFDELMLLPAEKLQEEGQRAELAAALEGAARRLKLLDDLDDGPRSGPYFPSLRFDELLTELALLAPAFSFQLCAIPRLGRAVSRPSLSKPPWATLTLPWPLLLPMQSQSVGAHATLPRAPTPYALPPSHLLHSPPSHPLRSPRSPPYFLNNARAIATLEGMAKSADPDFDVLQVVYPFALRRLLSDPRGSPRLRATLRELTHDAHGRPDLRKLSALLRESAALTGRSRLAVLTDAALTRGGRAFALDFMRTWLVTRPARAAGAGESREGESATTEAARSVELATCIDSPHLRF